MKLKFITVLLTISVSLFSFTPSYAESNLVGAGSTFIGNFMDQCRVKYSKEGLGTVGYTGNGSGTGKNFLTQRLVDFAGSDVPFATTDVQPKAEVLHIPIVAGPIAIAYNLPNYKTRLNLSKEVLAKIFAGQITMWNDPEIQKLNISKLPKIKIFPIYRADGSGTSEVFTSYLNAVAPSIWTKPGNKNFSSAFPSDINKFAGKFQNASGSMQVAMLNNRYVGSIAYNEITYARGLGTAWIENGAGKFIKPTVNSTSAFLSGLKFNSDGTAKLDFNSTYKSSYSISTFSYVIVYRQSGSKSSDLKNFLNYALTKCTNIEGYAPLKGNALKVAKLQVLKITN